MNGRSTGRCAPWPMWCWRPPMRCSASTGSPSPTSRPSGRTPPRPRPRRGFRTWWSRAAGAWRSAVPHSACCCWQCPRRWPRLRQPRSRQPRLRPPDRLPRRNSQRSARHRVLPRNCRHGIARRAGLGRPADAGGGGGWRAGNPPDPARARPERSDAAARRLRPAGRAIRPARRRGGDRRRGCRSPAATSPALIPIAVADRHFAERAVRRHGAARPCAAGLRAAGIPARPAVLQPRSTG